MLRLLWTTTKIFNFSFRTFDLTIDDAQRFKEHDYEVTRKDGLVFLREMAAEVKNFMDFKMNAVMVSSQGFFHFVVCYDQD